MNTRTRRDFLRTTMGGAAAATLASPLGYIGGAAAADPVQGVTWGGMWLDLIKEITDAQSIAMNWNTFPAGGSNSIVALTRASWPRPAYDISANWDPVWNLMYREGWLEAVTEADVPNLADVPKSIRIYSNEEGATFGIPYSMAAIYWGYRTDLVDIEINSMQDLLHPSLKGQICISSTDKNNGLTQVSMALGNGGDEFNMDPGWEFQKELIKSGNVGRWSNSDVDFINSINTGETAVGYGVTANWNAIKENWPVRILNKVPGERGFSAYIAQEGFCIFKGPRSDDAKKIVNHMLAPENNQAYNEGLGQAPVNSKSNAPAAASDVVMTAEEYAQFAYFPDYDYIGKQSDAWVKLWETEMQPLIRGG